MTLSLNKKLHGVIFRRYEKSITAIGITFYFQRTVTEKDTQDLARLIDRGRELEQTKIREGIKELLGGKTNE